MREPQRSGPPPFLRAVAHAVHDPAVAPTARRGIASVCSAHPLVLEAALARGARSGAPVLIEATCNQVNQDGGYTGMTPADFRDRVMTLARQTGCPAENIILGGDHLGPNPWRHLPADEAMSKADLMVEAYARAGYAKLHLDASMGCAGEAGVLADAVVAERAARMASRAEATAPGRSVYVVGTEVPTPGGALEALDHLAPTAHAAALRTAAVTRAAFAQRLPASVWERVLALVVQPGVEFGADDVAVYDRAAARELVSALRDPALDGMVFEAHSTDYQPLSALRALVEDGFSVLKVGPALTFALREALYGLDMIADILRPGAVSLRGVMERLMLAEPGDWQPHYPPEQAALLRHFGYSDRIRYYWARPEAERAVASLFTLLEDTALPDPLLSQFLPRLAGRVRDGLVARTPRALALAAIDDVLATYDAACRPLESA